MNTQPFSSKSQSQIPTRGDPVVPGDSNPVNHNLLASTPRYPHVNRGCLEPTSALEEVVELPLRVLPRGSTIRADFKLRDRLVRIDDLHAKPVLRGTLLDVQLQRGSNGAVHIIP